ncbi:MAG: hypothetical protein LBV69_09780 [Bacteroidales bacterium]|jgi:hypothetical protein|nr:hypothetical protein [Bacteroidales bacterium]
MKKKILLLICTNIFLLSFSQQDSIKYDFSFQFKEGIYFNFNQLKYNLPLAFNKIINFPEGENEFEFFDTVIHLKFYDEYGILKEINKKDIWGYSIGGKPYIFFANKFNMIPSLGTISYFVTTVFVTRYYGGDYNPFYGGFYENYPIRSYKEAELRQFFLSMKTGKIFEYDEKNVSMLIKDDSQLSEQFEKLSKRKQKKQKYDFIIKYNERHPLYILEIKNEK